MAWYLLKHSDKFTLLFIIIIIIITITITIIIKAKFTTFFRASNL